MPGWHIFWSQVVDRDSETHFQMGKILNNITYSALRVRCIGMGLRSVLPYYL